MQEELRISTYVRVLTQKKFENPISVDRDICNNKPGIQ